jgi:hypothetical protein
MNGDDLIILSRHNLSDIQKLYTLTKFTKYGKHVAILMESRYTVNIELLLRQVSRFLSTEWSVIIYVTDNVYTQYCNLCHKLNNGIQVIKIEYPLQNVIDYNTIMLDISFWKSLSHFSKVLIFQTDTMMYRYGIEQFYPFDYVGAPWPEELGCDVLVGNGGFSIRTISAMIDCLSTLTHNDIKRYAHYDININKLGKNPEDIFFSQGMYYKQYRLPHITHAKYFSSETVYHHDLLIGSHQLDQYNAPLANKILIDSIIPYYTYSTLDLNAIRIGWNLVNSELKHIFTNPNGVFFNTWSDVNYIFEKERLHPHIPWVGIFHLTPVHTQNYYSTCNINILLKDPVFLEDLPRCKGIFTLSKYMKSYVKNMLSSIGYSHIQVDSLYHPISFNIPLFDPSRIDTINTVVSLGSQLRKCTTIYKIKTDFKRIWLPARSIQQCNDLLDSECREFNIYISQSEREAVHILKLSNNEYDALLDNSFIIIDLYDASANNAIIECIARNIPCFVNRIPPVIEYIGEDYPLLFDSLHELEEMLVDKKKIHSAYDYLVEHIELKERLTINSFISDILNSPITTSILSLPNLGICTIIDATQAQDITELVFNKLLSSSEDILFSCNGWIEYSDVDKNTEYIRDAIQNGREIAKQIKKSFENIQFQYGKDDIKIDITSTVMRKCLKNINILHNNIIEKRWHVHIPAIDYIRDNYLGDPLPGIHKNVYLTYYGVSHVFDDLQNVLVFISYDNQEPIIVDDTVRFEYGIDNTVIDITSTVLIKCLDVVNIVYRPLTENRYSCIYIPAIDDDRDALFGDTFKGVHKDIHVIYKNHTYIFKDTDIVYLLYYCNS